MLCYYPFLFYDSLIRPITFKGETTILLIIIQDCIGYYFWVMNTLPTVQLGKSTNILIIPWRFRCVVAYFVCESQGGVTGGLKSVEYGLMVAKGAGNKSDVRVTRHVIFRPQDLHHTNALVV